MKHTTLVSVASVQDSVSSMLDSCSKTRNRLELQKHLTKGLGCIASAITAIGAFKRSTVKTRKSLEVLHNTVSGMLNGLESESITLPEFRSVCKTLVNTTLPRIQDIVDVESETMDLGREPEVSESDSTEPEADANLVQALDKDDWRNNLKSQWAKTQAESKSAVVSQGQTNQEFRKKLLSNLEGVNTAEVLHRFKSEGAKLPSKLKGGYGLVRLPVIPMFENPMAITSAGLKKISIRHSDIGGYPVFESQYVLLISKKEIKALKPAAAVKRNIKAAKPLLNGKEAKTQLPSNMKIELNNRPTVEYARSVLQLLNEHVQQKFVLASEKFVLSPKNADHVCFWIMPAPLLSALNRTSHNAKVVEWSFPFSIEDFRVD